MSLVFLTSHNENIYDVDRKVHHMLDRPERYISKRIIPKGVLDVREVGPHQKLIASVDPRISSHKTMGYATTPFTNPCNFLRKREGIKWMREKNHTCGGSRYLPPVPKASEIMKIPDRQIKNFKVINIEKVKSAKAYRKFPRYADTRNGDTHGLCNAGIMPSFIFSPNFGKIPRYLLSAPKRLDLALEQAIEDHKNLQASKEGMDLLNSNERTELLFGLKRNWNELQKKFQALPVFTDTQAKKLRKAKLENELRQLEQDILLIENNPQIYICK